MTATANIERSKGKITKAMAGNSGTVGVGVIVGVLVGVDAGVSID
jgi:hypothetical protein